MCYFSQGESEDKNLGKCLGVAFADKPEGPFTDKGTPLICGEEFTNIGHNSIFRDGKGKYLSLITLSENQKRNKINICPEKCVSNKYNT